MQIHDYLKSLSKKNASAFRKQLASTLGISASYARHLCNGTRAIPPKSAFLIERLTGGVVTRFAMAPDHYITTEGNYDG